MKAQACYIGSLPHEILRQIFIVHVWENTWSPFVLLHVCRLWHNVATSTSSLWSNLFLGNPISSKGYHTQSMVTCRNLLTLARAIQRLQSTPFELSLNLNSFRVSQADIERFKDLVEENWMAQCRVLSFIQLSALAGWAHFLKLLCSQQYVQLRELAVWNVSIPIAQEMNGLVSQIQDTAIKLSILRFVGVASDWTPQRLRDYPVLCSRLKVLHFVLGSEISLDSLSKLEELAVISVHGNGLALPSTPTLHTLRLIAPPERFSPTIYEHLTHFTLIMDTPKKPTAWYQSEEGSVSMPNLRTLELRRSYVCLPLIDAPKLHTLELLNLTYSLPLFASWDCRLKPGIVHVDKSLPDWELIAFLRRVGDSLRALHCTLVKSQESFGSKLAEALCGNGRTSPPINPNMNQLTVVSPVSLEKVREKPTMTNLRKVNKSLNSLGKRVHIRYGYMPTRKGEPLTLLERGRVDIEWFDL
ncbi:hypothetical protein CPB86DRAFT_736308 [Serendipita vermifera]|nr:hypothetical protein CPB86DRAFT_736308 [Serendipita vermifera]